MRASRVAARQPEPAWRPLDPALDLGAVLAFRHTRTVARDNTVKYHWRTLQLLPSPQRPSYAGARVEVLERPGGELAVRHQGETIASRLAPPRAGVLRERRSELARDPALERIASGLGSGGAPPGRPDIPAAANGPPSTVPHRRPGSSRCARPPRASRRSCSDRSKTRPLIGLKLGHSRAWPHPCVGGSRTRLGGRGCSECRTSTRCGTRSSSRARSQRQVAREMGLARDTVRRYLATPLPEPRKRKRPRPVLEQVRPRLEQLVEEWSERTTAKQRITGRRLQRALREEGYEVGITLVLEYLREWAPPARRSLRAARPPPGRERADRLLRGQRRALRRAAQGLALPDAADALGAGLRPALRAPGPARLPRRPRAGLRPLRRGAPAHGLRQPRSGGAAGAVPAPRPDRALRGARQPLRRRALLRAPPARGTTRAAWSPAAGACGCRCSRRSPAATRCRSSRSRCRGRSTAWRRSGSGSASPAEQPALRPLPEVAFEARRLLQPVSVSRSALVRVEGAWYSVPERWAGLSVMAWLGRGGGDAQPRDGAGEPSPPALRRPAGELPPLPRRTLAQATGAAAGGAGAARGAGRALRTAGGRCWRASAAAMRLPAR